MTRRVRATRYSVLILLILATISAAAIARWCMASGLGISSDSVIYLSAADSLSAGHGFRSIGNHFTPAIAEHEPLVIFPPAYPLLLSLSGWLSDNRLNGARWLHTILFAANICLVGIIVSLSTAKSVRAILCAILFFLSSATLFELHTMAWSEPPFILFLLLAVLLLILHLRTPGYVLLVASSLATSLALTTRYAGVTILAPMVLTIFLIGNRPIRSRVRDALILVGIGILPLAIWLVGNFAESGSATKRSMAIHPIGFSDLSNITSSLLVFWVPFSGPLIIKILLLLICGALVLTGVVLALRDRECGDSREQSGQLNAAALMLTSFFVITYLLFLVVYNSLTDPAVELSSRVLSPVYVFGIILVFSLLHRLSRPGKGKKLAWGVFLFLVALLSGNILHTVAFAVERHRNGRGYTSREWAGSESVKYLEGLPESRPVYSNGIDVSHFLAKKEVLRLPAKSDPSNGKKKNAEFEQEMNTLRNQLIQDRAVVVYFDKITWRWYLPTRDELEHAYGLPVLSRLDDGVVFGVK
ncbi:MAG TPA: hypothetical protein VGN90_06815 [Pyrinomonadaceae bacterium]|jgi:hypothetical protein|nr:hypothetical protein [Pyrinomonadaceae bacterium]